MSATCLSLLPNPHPQDGRFVLKTIRRHETARLLSILDDYLLHVVASTDTLLPRFYGLYSLRLGGAAERSAIVMPNLVHTAWASPELRAAGLLVGRMYDLKAALERPVVERADQRTTVLKDAEFKDERLDLGPVHNEAFLKALRCDTDFLAARRIMDYSLMVTVSSGPVADGGAAAEMRAAAAEIEEARGGGGGGGGGGNDGAGEGEGGGGRGRGELRWGFVPDMGVENAGRWYSFGLIDCLQTYSVSKQAERLLKTAVTLRNGGQPSQLSVQSQTVYARRLVAWMEARVGARGKGV